MGKSTCADLLRARGIPVVDTDDLARQTVSPGQPALQEIQELFGPGVLDRGGSLRRDELARKVFSNPTARRELEAILHPRIRELWREQVGVFRVQSHLVGAVVIPLLFETGAEKELDVTVCVACSGFTQHQRLLARGWSAEQAEQRIAAQWPVERKIGQADYLIWSEAGLELHAAQLDRILARVAPELPLPSGGEREAKGK
jgi:dephospho-CoA kinase